MLYQLIILQDALLCIISKLYWQQREFNSATNNAQRVLNGLRKIKRQDPIIRHTLLELIKMLIAFTSLNSSPAAATISFRFIIFNFRAI